ncbi:lysophospholipase [Planctomicrobium sp. SH527]|uniref:alpha/beta hydrolase n=1 Tax=Planctomicrobium sp. SH527 TaxID=3448123 RepID=UPI003F5B6E46
MTNTESTLPPVSVEEAFHTCSDGLRIYSCVHAPATINGTILLTHGMGEHSGRYGHLIHGLTSANFAVVRFDLRGHGRSDGARGHAPDYEVLMDDITMMFHWARARFPNKPYIMYGHSLGGNLVANWVLRRRIESAIVSGAILSSPWFRLTDNPSPMKIQLIKSIAGFWPTFAIPAKFRPRRLMRNETAIEAYVKDPLIHRRVTVNMASQAFDAGIWALDHASEFPIPSLCLHGSADTITSPIATAQFSEHAPNSTMRLWPNLVHEPHNEPEWREVVAEIVTWVQETVKNSPRIESHNLATAIHASS